ncbi:histamine H4 receptor isoform X2 [Suncus etruscus]|uniref:histamine H4 receptor isoform X2 n=1 Tax=Suncus etruscus TaxID=109475 RepID=UPI002110C7A4|nr:histamine H4 receptor isoform X2 [Suncus etruscus]
MSFLAFAIMLGNAVVIIAFMVDKNLRHRSNYFFLNLAISDFLVVSESWKNGKRNCEPGFFSEWYILVITSLLEFLVPVFLVAYFNLYIYLRIWKRSHHSQQQRHTSFSSVSSSNYGHSCRLLRADSSGLKKAAPSLHLERQGRKSSLFFSLRTKMNINIIASKVGSVYHLDSVTLHQREHFEILRAQKLARSLAILLGVFVVCWAPYSLFTLFRSIYHSNQYPKTIEYEITFWLQWLNSLINPFLYPLCHKHFQKTFLKILCIKK